MKKLKHIAIVLVLLAAVSCQKDNIMPATGTHSDQPSWKNDLIDESKSSSGKSESGYSDKSIGTDGSGVDTNTGTGDDSGITDPNNDPDVSKRKGKK